ncbi:hypothetical protein GH714_010190 [Hevea brasiliensis]|uniref:Uncharacterized protein n=1 Tax=Hevea brasiliensis TaxID=3981 RepID=A0A6A6L0M1_HEVBR|nr:hypothetical protein GH714_010190 [Hevea brasiliensis]
MFIHKTISIGLENAQFTIVASEEPYYEIFESSLYNNKAPASPVMMSSTDVNSSVDLSVGAANGKYTLEGSSNLIQKVELEGRIHGIKIAISKPPISDLFSLMTASYLEMDNRFGFEVMDGWHNNKGVEFGNGKEWELLSESSSHVLLAASKSVVGDLKLELAKIHAIKHGIEMQLQQVFIIRKLRMILCPLSLSFVEAHLSTLFMIYCGEPSPIPNTASSNVPSPWMLRQEEQIERPNSLPNNSWSNGSGRVSLNQKGETRNFDVKEEIDFLNDAAFLHGDGDKEEVDIVGDGESKKIDIIDGEEIVLDQLDSIQNENMAVEDQYDIPVEVQKVIIHPQLGSEEKYED